MFRSLATVAFVTSLFLTACQTGASRTKPNPGNWVLAATAIEGNWASTDGVFLGDFRGGTFTTKRTQDNKLLAQGTYSTSGNQVVMRWASLATSEQLSATCTMS